MSHKEDLLAGAVACLREKGYAHTTARDIVAASGTNLASIGYHYGSTKALLNAAVLQALEEFGEQMAQAMGTGAIAGETTQVIVPSGVCVAPTPKVEAAGVTKSTWKRRTKTWFSTVPPVAELLMSMNHSGCPNGGGLPVRNVAGRKL